MFVVILNGIINVVSVKLMCVCMRVCTDNGSYFAGTGSSTLCRLAVSELVQSSSSLS